MSKITKQANFRAFISGLMSNDSIYSVWKENLIEGKSVNISMGTTTRKVLVKRFIEYGYLKFYRETALGSYRIKITRLGFNIINHREIDNKNYTVGEMVYVEEEK